LLVAKSLFIFVGKTTIILTMSYRDILLAKKTESPPPENLKILKSAQFEKETQKKSVDISNENDKIYLKMIEIIPST